MTTRTASRPRKDQPPKPVANPITHYPAWCKRCGICIAFCPKTVYDTAPDGGPLIARPADCIRCHMCELRCPDFALSVANKEDDS